MDLHFSKENKDFRAEVIQFIKDHVPAGMEAEEAESAWEEREDVWEHAKRYFRALGERRWLTMSWPEHYGGLNWGAVRLAIYHEEAAYRGAPMHFTFISAVGNLGGSIIQYGTDEQKRSYLPRIVTGEVGACNGLSEPGAGSDLAALQTRAVRNGDYYVVNGQKTFTTYAHRADYMRLAARTDPEASRHRGITLFILDMKSPGVTVRPLWNLLGGRQNEVFFDDVHIPAENVIGEVDKGWYQLGDNPRYGFGSSVAGPARARKLLEEFIDFAKHSEYQGRRLSSDPYFQHRVAELAIELEVWRVISWRAVISRESSSSVQRVGGGLHNATNSLGALWGKEWMPKFSHTIVELLSSYPKLTTEPSVAPFLSKMNTLRLASYGNHGHGTPELQRNVISTRGLGLPR